MTPELGHVIIGCAGVVGIGAAGTMASEARVPEKVSVFAVRTLYRWARFWWALAMAVDTGACQFRYTRQEIGIRPRLEDEQERSAK